MDLAGWAFATLRIGDGTAEHLVAAAHSEHQPAAARVRPNIDLQPAGTQNLKIGDCRLGARKNHKIGVPRQSHLVLHRYHLNRGFHAQWIKVIEVGDARKNGNSNSDLRVASAWRWTIKTERVFGWQEIRIAKKRDEAQRRPTRRPRNCVKPLVKQARIAAEFVHDETGDHR